METFGLYEIRHRDATESVKVSHAHIGPSVREDALVTQSFHNGTHIGARGPDKFRKLLMCHPDIHDITDTMVARPSLEAYQINECHRNALL